jgi:hypothetical protein
MPAYHSITDEELQSIFDQIIAYLHNKNLTEPDWREISYLLEHNKYSEIMDGMIDELLLDLYGLAIHQFNDDFFSEYLEEGEKINNSKRVDFARERITWCYEQCSDHVFSLHALEIQNKESQKGYLGFTVSGPGGQHGYNLDCIGVFSSTKELMKLFDKNYFLNAETISKAHILRLWKESESFHLS